MRLVAFSTLASTCVLAAVVAVPAAAQSPDPGGASAPSANPAPGPSTGTTGPTGGGSSSAPAQPTVAGSVAKIVNGLAYAPAGAPAAVQRAIWAANRIVGKPYIYGGGHRAFAASGYDCSGTVSYALHGGGLLRTPYDSTDFERWGVAGAGQWITVFANGGHAYMDIAGIRLDTSAADDPGGLSGPRWRPLRHSNAGYRVRHLAVY